MQKNIGLFVSSISTFLAAHCVGSTAVPRGEVCEAGGLDKKNSPLITDLIDAGFLPGYKIRTGPQGGVCRVDATTGPSADRVNPEFLAKLKETLNLHVPPLNQGAVTRGKIAAEMGVPSGETEAKISQAISLKLCTGYASKRGVGIFRQSAAEMAAEKTAEKDATVSAEGAAEAVPEAEAATAEAAPVETVEAAPVEAAPAEAAEAAPAEAPKLAKRSHKKKTDGGGKKSKK